MILTNPVVISVVVMIALCLFNLNIVLALLIAALVAGVSAGMSISDTMGTLIGGMGGNAETALSYFLLGTFAVAIGQTGIASIACKKIAKVVKGRKYSGRHRLYVAESGPRPHRVYPDFDTAASSALQRA